MTHKQAIASMQAIVERGDHDREVNHYDADELLCRVLTDLGYGELIDAYREVRKWYA